MSNKECLSIIVPCYNEQKNIPVLLERIERVFAEMDYDYEVIFVDNGSMDLSREVFLGLVQRSARVKVVLLSRNFGNPQQSFLCGMDYAKGQATILMDCDLQDPPELIPALVAKWKEGYPVVFGIRKNRKENIIRRIGYFLFYRLWKWMAEFEIPLDAGEFGLLDEKIVKIIKSVPEKDVFLRGLRAWVGFAQVGIPYDRPGRKFGKTTFGILKYIRVAKDAFATFSTAPLEMVSFLAIFSAIVTGLATTVYLYLAITTTAPRGFFTLLLSNLFFGTLQLLCLGIIAEYLIRIFREVKARPPFIVEKILRHNGSDGDEEK